ncbi:MAG: aspartate/methionine/tyrosine aminotransferase [bacterium]|jgi:aspartate/methionine/tyrosine aminotransferase
MNPLASELNEQIQSASGASYSLLSELGKELFFPKGILSQSAEAKEKAHKFNATIGIATEGGAPMYLPVTRKFFSDDLTIAEIYPYAPPAGRPKLRSLWKEKMIRENPSLKEKTISNPVVTSALTHGLSIIADLFVDKDDVLLSPDKLWGNYRLTFCTRRNGKIDTFPLFNANDQFNCDGFEQKLKEIAEKQSKVIILLNFPNNPTGYTPSVEEGDKIVSIIQAQAEKGTEIVTVSDDAYFGLFFEDSLKESLFGKLADVHENVLAIKLDGATKENFAWGFRTGFITFGTKSNNTEALYTALEKKVMGIIRGTISNCPQASQSIIEKLLEDPDYSQNQHEKYLIMKGRANKTKEVLEQEKFAEHWTYYPFNSGYFMCLKLKNIDANTLRLHLLDQYGVGTISLGSTDLRVAFSCIEEGDIKELFELIFAACNDLSKS